MSFSVVTNLSSINAQATLDGTQRGLQRTLRLPHNFESIRELPKIINLSI